MRRFLLSALLLSTLAAPALGQVTLQLGNQQQGDPRDQQSDNQRDQERDAQRDRARDAQRDQARDAQRDRQRDAQRDAERDRQHDADRRAEYQSNRSRYDGQRDQQQVYGYSSRDDQRDWRFDGTPYRVNPYAYPQGGSYRARVAGDYVSRAYRGPERYWIGDPAAYRLNPAVQGARWIRVGPDALMVRIADGIVVSSVRGLFD